MSIATAGMWRPNYFYELDGVDVYQSIVAGGVSPRNETLLNIIDDAVRTLCDILDFYFFWCFFFGWLKGTLMRGAPLPPPMSPLKVALCVMEFPA